MGRYTIRAWHHILQGWKGNQRGSSHSSAGTEFTPCHAERECIGAIIASKGNNTEVGAQDVFITTEAYLIWADSQCRWWHKKAVENDLALTVDNDF